MKLDTVKVRVLHLGGLYLMELGLSLQWQQLLLVNLLDDKNKLSLYCHYW